MNLFRGPETRPDAAQRPSLRDNAAAILLSKNGTSGVYRHRRRNPIQGSNFAVGSVVLPFGEGSSCFSTVRRRKKPAAELWEDATGHICALKSGPTAHLVGISKLRCRDGGNEETFCLLVPAFSADLRVR